MTTAPPPRTRSEAGRLFLAGFVLAGLAAGVVGCALGPVSRTPEEEAARNAAMAADCARRGGVWDRQAKVCLGADSPR